MSQKESTREFLIKGKLTCYSQILTLGLEGDVGTLAVGKRADMVLWRARVDLKCGATAVVQTVNQSGLQFQYQFGARSTINR